MDTNSHAGAIHRLEQRLRVLSDTTRAFAEATVDYRRLLDTIAESLARIVKDSCVVSVVSDDERSLTPVAIRATSGDAARLYREMLADAPVRLDERTVTEGVFRTGVAALVPRLDLSQLGALRQPLYVDFLRALGVHSALIVALRHQGRSIGVLSLLRYSPESPPFDEGDRELAQMVADHAALAITNSRLLASRTSAEARFRAVVENSADGVVLSTAAGTFLYVSPAAARMLGRAADEVIGRSFRDYVHPDDVQGAIEQRRRLFEEPGPHAPVLRRMVRPDGSFRWVEVTATNLLADPAIGAVVSNLRDVTERKLAEDALVEQIRFATLGAEIGVALAAGGTLREMLQRSTDAIVEHLGAALACVWALNAEKRVLELEASAALDARLEAPGTRIPVGMLQIGRIAQRRRPSATNDLLADGDLDDPAWAKREGLVAFAGYPLLVGGALVGVLAVFARQPLSEAALEKLASVADAVAVGIDRRFVERAKTNLEGQLRQSHKMEAIGRLAGGVAHDFNNMLSVILSYGEFLQGGLRVGDPMRSDVEEILKAARRAGELTRQLLLFSRQQVIEPKVVSLNELLANMHQLLERILGEDIDVRTLTKNPVGAVLADPGGVEQIVMNLVVNARDAMPTGGQLTIETANVVLDEEYAREHIGVKPGPYVMLAVSDTGAGMDEATQARIFEPFFTTKAAGKGTGLGLSTVFGIATQSGGSVWVYSEPGAGTTFKVYFPRVDAPVDVVGANVAPVTLRGSETILLVEDEDQVRAVARGILTRSGYNVIEARNAGEALLLCEMHKGTIHLLLSDVVMPRMSGPELAKRLSVTRPEMKVLCMSGYTDDSIVRHGVLEARFAFLQKPITPETLTRKVREVLDARAVTERA